MMEQWFGDNAVYFSIPALFGTAIFLLRMVMLLSGADDGGDLSADVGGMDGDMGGDMGGDADLSPDGEPLDHGGANPDATFRIISFQTIAAFLMGAGWGGLGAYRGSNLEFGWSLLIAAACGTAMLYLFAWLMKVVYDLQTSGNISPRQVVGQEAQVDVEIPSAHMGQGTVKIVVNDRMRRYRAITEGQTLQRGDTVRITRLNPDNTMTVTRV